jgi:deoxyribonuclease-2
MSLAFVLLCCLFYFSQVVQGRAQSGSGGIGCRNQAGQPVDWFILYKLPRDSSSSDAATQQGFGLLYMDGSTNGQWQQSNVGIDNDQQSAGFTLSQLYSAKTNPNAFHVLYNDEKPEGAVSITRGHTKGAVAFDQTSGFWLIHSAPKFPPAESYAYPKTASTYGQSFLCMTFNYQTLGDVGTQLFMNEPYIYDSSLPDAFAQDYPILTELVNGKTPKSAPYSSQKTLTTAGGVQLQSFAKSKQWGQDLYADLVAPTLQRNLFAETWQNGKGNIGSNCTAGYQVFNTATISPISGVSFTIHNDHSKWAVTYEKSGGGGTVCIGDINRQSTQYKRGGGTVCMQNKNVWQTFRNSISTFDQC